jgi:hypothetical protein
MASDMSGNSIFLTILATIAFGLLIVVSGGVAYMTAVEWRDRRRREQEKREAKRR